MKKEEIVELIDEIIEDKKYDNKLNLFMTILITLFGILTIWIIADTYRHNSDVDYHNEQLQFCKDIYYSDNVVLEQCRDYFVILEKGDDK